MRTNSSVSLLVLMFSAFGTRDAIPAPEHATQSTDYTLHTFTKIQLTDKYWSEAAAIGDINHDGHVDVVVGPYWYEGPDFKRRHAYAPATQTFKRKKPDGSEESIEGYEGALGSGEHVDLTETFLKVVDLNGDGWPDIISIGYPTPSVWNADRPSAVWYENPGAFGLKRGVQWKRYVISDDLYGHSMDFCDVFGTNQPVLVAFSGGKLGAAAGRVGYFTADPQEPTRPWTFHPVSWPVDEFQWYTHGLGCGDVNGDGRMDILHSDGWWEHPPSGADDPMWTYHPYPFQLGPGQIKQDGYRGPGDPLRVAVDYDVSSDGIPNPVTIYGGSQMYVDDVNGDGLPDVVTSLVAHGYGLAWWEQIKGKDRWGQQPLFKRHIIINKEPNENKYGLKISEMQAVAFTDIDGDGLKDIVTGKRFWAHTRNESFDPEPNAPAVLYWFRQVRHADKSVEFVPYLIDDNSGAGTQIAIGDVNGDGLPDIVVTNTKGAFVFIQKVRKVSQQDWERAQPPVLYPDAK
jgi:FG-GAP-like repeat